MNALNMGAVKAGREVRAAMNALNMGAVKAGREVLAAMNALNMGAVKAGREVLAAMNALNMGAVKAGREARTAQAVYLKESRTAAGISSGRAWGAGASGHAETCAARRG